MEFIGIDRQRADEGEAAYLQRNDGGSLRDERSSRGQGYLAQLQSRCGAAAEGGFEAASRYSEDAALLASGLRAQAADQRKNAGKVGAVTREAQSSGGGTGTARAEISGYAGATGCFGCAVGWKAHPFAKNAKKRGSRQRG